MRIIITGDIDMVDPNDLLHHVNDARIALTERMPLTGGGLIGDVQMTISAHCGMATITYNSKDE